MIEVQRESSARPPKPDYLRFVFERDVEGGVVKDNNGIRSISAVEHIADRAVIHTVKLKPDEVDQSVVDTVGESELDPTEVILLEN